MTEDKNHPLNGQLITVELAQTLLRDSKAKHDERFAQLVKPGQYILADYRLTRKREAFKIRAHTFLKKQYKSYVAFDSDNGQTLWMHNFSSLSEALFWLDTGFKSTDTDTNGTYAEWKENHKEDIDAMKAELKAFKDANKKKHPAAK